MAWKKTIVHCNTALNGVIICNCYCLFSHDSDNLMIVMLSDIIWCILLLCIFWVCISFPVSFYCIRDMAASAPAYPSVTRPRLSDHSTRTHTHPCANWLAVRKLNSNRPYAVCASETRGGIFMQYLYVIPNASIGYLHDLFWALFFTGYMYIGYTVQRYHVINVHVAQWRI